MLARDQRITQPDDFRRVVRRGERVSTPHAIVYRHGGDKPRVGIVVSKKCGNAVERNTLRRRTRSIARELLDTRGLTGDIVIRFRGEGTIPDFTELRDELSRAVERWTSTS